jgi:hypothetical protein
MQRILSRCGALLAVVWIGGSASIHAQNEPGRIMGRVTDSSGGALPGVTVAIASDQRGSVVATVTDGSGEYRSPGLPPGTYRVTFDLAGFEPSEVKTVVVRPGESFILDRQLGLAALAETVEVVGVTPKPPPPAPRPPIRKRPAFQPVPQVVLASVCGPRQAPEVSAIAARIAAHRDDMGRKLFGAGDVIVLDGGADRSLSTGMNLAVRRRSRVGDRSVPMKSATIGEFTSGLVQIVEVDTDTSVAVVVYACGEFEVGDTVEWFDQQPELTSSDAGKPDYENPARILFGDHGQSLGSPTQLMVIDRGENHGAQRGQRLTIFRRALGDRGPVTALADAVIVAVRPDSSTIRIERARDAVSVGDLVALHR